MQRKRRLEAKTDYKAREVLLRSKKPRLVFRKTNKYIIGQLITSKEAQDFVITGVVSNELLKYGWAKTASGSLKSIPASYLTGYLMGKKMQDKGVNDVVYDIGMIRNVKGSRVYAFLKGVIDSGIILKAGDIFPQEARIVGKHLVKEIKVQEIKSILDKKFV